jgi:hypothetical protein
MAGRKTHPIDVDAPCVRIVTVPAALGAPYGVDCPKCGHGWDRHIQRAFGYACCAREVDASGNFDGCGCGERPPNVPHVCKRFANGRCIQCYRDEDGDSGR